MNISFAIYKRRKDNTEIKVNAIHYPNLIEVNANYLLHEVKKKSQ